MNCNQCSHTILQRDKHLNCVQCHNCFHLKCLPHIRDEDYNYIVSSKFAWKCQSCEKEKFAKGSERVASPIVEKTIHFGTAAGNSDSDSSSISESKGTKPKIICKDCVKGFSHNSVRAVCTSCKANFHLRCVDINKDDYLKIQSSWICNECLVQTDEGGIIASMGKCKDQSVTLVDVLNEMKNFRSEVQNTNRDITENMTKYSDWISENSEKLKSLDKKLDQILTEIDQVKQENINLKKVNETLIKRINFLEQSSRDNELEIFGVPLKTNENIIDILDKISKAVSFTFDANMIDNCYRVTFQGNTQVSKIVVRFVRKMDKDMLMELRRKKRNLNTRDIGYMEGAASPIYMNDSLTPENRKLLNAARKLKQEKQYTYIWVRNGRVFVRKNVGDPRVCVESMEDLNKLI